MASGRCARLRRSSQGEIRDGKSARHLLRRDDRPALYVEVGQLDQEGPSEHAWPEPLPSMRVATQGCERSARWDVPQVRHPPKQGELRRRLWRSDAPDVVVSSIEASVSPSAATRSVAAKSSRFVGATRTRHARQGGLSRRRSGEPAPGPTSLARETRVPTESVFTTRSLGRSVDGATTPRAQADGASTR